MIQRGLVSQAYTYTNTIRTYYQVGLEFFAALQRDTAFAGIDVHYSTA